MGCLVVFILSINLRPYKYLTLLNMLSCRYSHLPNVNILYPLNVYVSQLVFFVVCVCVYVYKFENSLIFIQESLRSYRSY